MAQNNSTKDSPGEEADRASYDRVMTRKNNPLDLTKLLEGYFDKQLNELPKELRRCAATEFYPLRWDELTPEHRRAVALSIKRQLEPVSEEELLSAEKLIERKYDLDSQIEALKKTRTPTVFDLLGKKSNLEILQAEFVAVNKQITKARGEEHSDDKLDTPHTQKASVKAWKIMLHFVVKPSSEQNQFWWRTRMSDAKRYGLLDCRHNKGIPGNKDSSTWFPDQIAGWLIDKGHMKSDKAANTLRTHFSEYADAADLLSPPNK